jgi:hypothetical protein
MKTNGKKKKKVIVEKIQLWIDQGWTIKCKSETFGGTKIFAIFPPENNK